MFQLFLVDSCDNIRFNIINNVFIGLRWHRLMEAVNDLKF